MHISFPKFHDKTSLTIGAVAGLVLFIGMIIDMVVSFRPIQIYACLMGLVLSIHCLDMIKVYRKHRIIKVVKTDTERIIHKDVEKPNKLICIGNALKVVWHHQTFRIWVVICVVGIVIGLIVGIGMTQLVILVAIACIGWALETANTSIEMLLDIVNPVYSDKVKIVKDLYALVPTFIYSSYIITWLILVVPEIIKIKL